MCIEHTASGWEHADAADEKLHDFLLQLCGDEAQVLIDTPYLNGRGFEAWRLLNNGYSPCGGQYELDAMLALMQRKPVQNAVQVPGAISKLERDIALYIPRGRGNLFLRIGRCRFSYNCCPRPRLTR